MTFSTRAVFLALTFVRTLADMVSLDPRVLLNAAQHTDNWAALAESVGNEKLHSSGGDADFFVEHHAVDEPEERVPEKTLDVSAFQPPAFDQRYWLRIAACLAGAGLLLYALSICCAARRRAVHGDKSTIALPLDERLQRKLMRFAKKSAT